MSNTLRKISSIGLSLATVITLSGSAMVLPASAATVDDLQAQISALLAQITALQLQLSGAQGSTTASYNFTRDLTMGSKGDDVKALQQFLNSKGYAVASTGAGSAGNETTTFGSLTKAALAKYQAAVGISPTAGYFGTKTRAYVASVAATGGTTTGGTTTGGTTTPVGAALSVALASDSPAAKTLGSGTAFNKGLKVAFTAGSSDVSITGITLQKSGFVANTNLNGVDIIDSAGVRHGQVITSINADNTITINMTSDPIVVKAGKSETATVRFNLLAGAYSGTLSFSIASASAITSNATFTGSFPLSGAIMSIVDGSSSLATVTMNILTSTGSSTLNVDAASLQEITKYRIAETSSKEGVYLYSWALYNYGNAAAADYKDVTLEAQDGTVVATAQPSGQYVTFTPASPYFIDKGLTKDFTIKAKIAGGTTKTIKLVTYNDYDIDVRGATTGVSIIPTAVTNDVTFPLGNQWNQTTIGSGGITLQRASDSPSSAVTPGATGVVLAKYIVRPTGENYELRQVKFYVASSTTAGSVWLSGTVYVKVNNAIVYSVAASSIDNDALTTVNLSSYPILTAGQDNTIVIEGSISSSATANDTYKVMGFDLTSAKRLVSNDLLSDGDTGLALAGQDGLTIPVKAAKLVVTTLANPVAGSVVVGTSAFELAQIQLNAQSGGEDVKVTSIVVTNTKTANAAYADISNLLMYKDGETSALSTTASTATNAATVTFSFSSPIVVTKATPVTLHLKGNIVADAGASSTSTQKFNIVSSTSAVAATGYGTGNSLTSGSDITYAGNGQAMTVVSKGNLIFSLVSGSGASPSANQIVSAGTSNGVYLAFKLTSQYETQKITSLKLTSVAAALATTTLVNIRLYEGSATTAFASAPQFDTCTGTQCSVTFTASDNLLSAPVPSTGVTIYMKADAAAGGSGSILGDDFKFSIASSGDIAIKGAVSALTTGTITGSASSSGVSYIVPQTVKIEAVSPAAATQVGTSAGQTLAVFKVTNTGTAAISLSSSSLSFTNGGSATTSTSFKIYSSAMGGGQSDTSSWNSGNGWAAATGTTGASSTISFATTSLTAADRKIDGGSWRYLTIRNSAASANNDTYQFSVSALGNVLFNADEADLGYSGNSDTDLSDVIYGLYVDGIPALSTVTAKT